MVYSLGRYIEKIEHLISFLVENTREAKEGLGLALDHTSPLMTKREEGKKPSTAYMGGK